MDCYNDYMPEKRIKYFRLKIVRIIRPLVEVISPQRIAMKSSQPIYLWNKLTSKMNTQISNVCNHKFPKLNFYFQLVRNYFSKQSPPNFQLYRNSDASQFKCYLSLNCRLSIWLIWSSSARTSCNKGQIQGTWPAPRLDILWSRAERTTKNCSHKEATPCCTIFPCETDF